jgi:hypothetical protein
LTVYLESAIMTLTFTGTVPAPNRVIITVISGRRYIATTACGHADQKTAL